MKPSPDPLRPLIDDALAGDRRALDRLCRALSGPIYRLALRTLGHPEDAEDASQEVLVQVATHLSSFRGESKLMTWVYTLAVRHLLKRREGRARRRARTEEIAALIDTGLAITTPASRPSGEVKVLAREVKLACTQSMLLALTREERVAIVIVEVLGASAATAATICEVTPEALRQRLTRARNKLRPVLEERCGLRDEARPCRCTRQAAAKQMAADRGLLPERPRVWTRLPVVDDARLARAREQLGSIQRLHPVFAMDPPIGPPREIWKAVALRLPDIVS